MDVQRIVRELERERERLDLAIELLNELGSSAAALLNGRRARKRDRETQPARKKRPARLRKKRRS